MWHGVASLGIDCLVTTANGFWDDEFFRQNNHKINYVCNSFFVHFKNNTQFQSNDQQNMQLPTMHHFRFDHATEMSNIVNVYFRLINCMAWPWCGSIKCYNIIGLACALNSSSFIEFLCIDNL